MPKQAVKGQDYTVEKWGEYDNFCCTKCQFSSIYWQIYYEKHFLTAHIHKHRWAFPVPVDESKPQGEIKQEGPVY